MSRQIRKYTKEFKIEAVNLALKSPTISVTARELGLPVATLHTWIKPLKQITASHTGEKDNGNDMAALSLRAKERQIRRRVDRGSWPFLAERNAEGLVSP